MGMDHVIMLLKNVPLFENLNEEELVSIAPLFQQENYKKGTSLFIEGDEGNEFYLIESGFVKIAKLEDDKEITLALFSDGDFFGEMALVQKAFTRSASAETLESSSIYKLSRNDFHEFMLSSPKLCLNLLEISMDRLRKANEQIHDLTFLNVRSRILKNIHRLSEEYGKNVQGGILIDLKLTHQQLANIAGTVQESVTKVLQELQDDHVIVIENKRIIIKNLEKLKQY